MIKAEDLPFDYDGLVKLPDTHVCSECGSGISVAWGGAYKYDGYIVRCSRNINHSGVMRRGIPTVYEIAQGVKEMTNKELQQYQFKPQLSLEEADEILQLFWPKADPTARFKGASICHTYGLDPRLNHVALMKFGDQWVAGLEIKATRILARRQGNWSYLDLTPRAATEEEIKRIFGDQDMSDHYVSITIIKDDNGHEASGVGVIRKADNVYGDNE